MFPNCSLFAVLDGSNGSYESASALNLTARMASRPVVLAREQTARPPHRQSLCNVRFADKP